MGAAPKLLCDEAWIRSHAATSLCRPRSEKWVLAATILGSSMAFIDGTVVNLALPVLQGSFSASVGAVQWVMESYALLLAALLLPGGALGDRFGRRRIFGTGVLAFTLASVLCGAAPGVGVLIAARGLQGIGAALLIPTSLAILGASFPPERRGRAIGTWSAFTSITTALGPVLGGWMVEHLSWRWVFYINVPIGIAVLGLLRAHVPESHARDRPAAVDLPGMILAAAGLGALVYGLIEGSEGSLLEPAVLAPCVAGIVLLALFVLVEARSRAPMVPLALFRVRAFAGVNALTVLLYGALYGGLFFLPFNLLQAQGYTATGAGLAMLPFSVILFLLSGWSGGLVDRFGPRLPLVAGPAVAAAGFALFLPPGIGGSYWTTFFPAVALLGFGMAITVAPLTATVLASAGEANTGVASGVNNAVSRVAGLLAIAVLGVVMVDSFGDALTRGLGAARVDRSVIEALHQQRTHLAALEPPPGVDEGARAAIEDAVRGAFVAGFRRVMGIAAALAALSALIGLLSVGSRRAAQDPQFSAPPRGT